MKNHFVVRLERISKRNYRKLSEGIKVFCRWWRKLFWSGPESNFFQYPKLGEHMMASRGDQASSGMDIEACYRCRKAVLASEQGIEYGGCKLRFHAKCEKILKPTYTAIVNHSDNKNGSLLV